MTRRNAGSLVLGVAVLLQGCAGLLPRPEATVAPADAVSARGRFEVRAGRPGLVIGAPHGTSDSGTDIMGRELARLTGWGLVVVTGFSHLDAAGRRLNVNRPTESVPGSPARLEAETEEARRVYQAYQRHVSEAAQGALLLYIEVHGNGHQESAGRVEIATVGVSREDAWRLKTLLELIRDSRLGAGDGVPRLEIRVESVDPLRYTASAAKQRGALAASRRALHIELPRPARTTYRDAYTELLADFLTQSAAFLAPPGR